ncbi:MAG: alpha/beta hydrolase [Proteobacteria bacterium]|nr:alpha/beta hydrolase [Pseudomonadota bacterium]
MSERESPLTVTAAPSPRAVGRFVVDDGTELAYQVYGATQAPAFAIAGALGVAPAVLSPQIAALSRRYRVVCMDYRGTGAARGGPLPGDLSPPRLARDLGAVLDRVDVRNAVLVGWGLGVAVAFELARQRPALPAAVVALCGTAGRPLRAALPLPLAWAGEQLVAQLAGYPDLVEHFVELTAPLPRALLAVLRTLLPAAEPVDRKSAIRGLGGRKNAERAVLLRLLVEQLRHDASDVVPRLGCPLLVITGTRDRLTSTAAGRALAAAAPDGEQREVEGATRFAALEQPVMINRWLLELARKVYRPAP